MGEDPLIYPSPLVNWLLLVGICEYNAIVPVVVGNVKVALPFTILLIIGEVNVFCVKVCCVVVPTNVVVELGNVKVALALTILIVSVWLPIVIKFIGADNYVAVCRKCLNA